MRDHQSHDVLLMCIGCHQESNLHDFGLRKMLEVECDAPIGTADDVKVRLRNSNPTELPMLNQDARNLIPYYNNLYCTLYYTRLSVVPALDLSLFLI